MMATTFPSDFNAGQLVRYGNARLEYAGMTAKVIRAVKSRRVVTIRWDATGHLYDANPASLQIIAQPSDTDPGPDGKRQTVLQGCAKASSAEIARRRARMPLQAKTAQRACDVGLFSDAADQLDLCEMFQDSTEEE